MNKMEWIDFSIIAFFDDDSRSNHFTCNSFTIFMKSYLHNDANIRFKNLNQIFMIPRVPEFEPLFQLKTQIKHSFHRLINA